MSRKGPSAELSRILEEGYQRKAWHGPNLKGSLRGVTPAQAAFRPAPGRHSIRELALHAAYWKYTVWRRLTGQKRGSFPLAGSNWFPRSGVPSAKEWKKEKELLEREHRRLGAVVARLPARPPQSILRQVYGVALHDAYHTGQIQYVKRLLRGRRAR